MIDEPWGDLEEPMAFCRMVSRRVMKGFNLWQVEVDDITQWVALALWKDYKNGKNVNGSFAEYARKAVYADAIDAIRHEIGSRKRKRRAPDGRIVRETNQAALNVRYALPVSFMTRAEEMGEELDVDAFRRDPAPYPGEDRTDLSWEFHGTDRMLARRILPYFVRGYTQKQIADEMGVTDARVCQIVRKLRRAILESAVGRSSGIG